MGRQRLYTQNPDDFATEERRVSLNVYFKPVNPSTVERVVPPLGRRYDPETAPEMQLREVKLGLCITPRPFDCDDEDGPTVWTRTLVWAELYEPIPSSALPEKFRSELGQCDILITWVVDALRGEPEKSFGYLRSEGAETNPDNRFAHTFSEEWLHGDDEVPPIVDVPR